MFRKFMVPAVLSVAFLAATCDMAYAQRGGRWGGGRWGGGGWGGRGWDGGRVGVYVGPGWYGGGYYGNGGYYGGYYNQPYAYDGYSYSYPTYSYPANSYNSYYPSTPEYVPPAANNSATIRVMVPDPQARIFFDGRQTNQQGTDRVYSTPDLTSTGSYVIRATWMRDGKETSRERTVSVAPGQSVNVDFRQSN